MIEKISWATYATALVIIILIYYIVIALLYYRKEISLVTNGLQKRLPDRASSNREASVSDIETISSSSSFNNNAVTESSKESSDSSDISITAFDLVEKIKSTILQYGEKKYIKEEILTGIHLLLKEYPQLKYSAYANAINNIIAKECVTHCSIRLEDDEVKRLWV